MMKSNNLVNSKYFGKSKERIMGQQCKESIYARFFDV